MNKNNNTWFKPIVVALTVLLSTHVAAKKNVLLIMADDFNHWIPEVGYYQQAFTPNISKLASQGVLFADASSASPVCLPSREALWSGHHPSKTGIDNNRASHIRDLKGFKNTVTMNQHFKQNGYYVYGGGKLYHPGSMGRPKTDGTNWSDVFTGKTGAVAGSDYKWASKVDAKYAWSASTKNVEQSNDTKLARHMANKISQYNQSKPFFIGVGFFRPHLPWHAPKQFYDLFNPKQLDIPAGYLKNDLKDIPKAKADAAFNEMVKANKWKEGIRAYLANLAYADFNVGIVLDALNKSKHKNNTIVVFVGDHGWHIGEKDRLSKHAVYDQASRTTLVIYDPSARGNGKISRKVVSMLDLYPTLSKLAGLKAPNHVAGNDLSPLLNNPNSKQWQKPILITYSGVNIIKTNEWRFIDDGIKSQLYDMKNDPYEWHNLYNQGGYSQITSQLRNQIKQMLNTNNSTPSQPTIPSNPNTPSDPTTPAQNLSNIKDLSAKVLSCNQVQLNWTDVSSATSYIVRRKGTKGGFVNLGQVSQGKESFKDTTAKPKTRYIYQVRPSDGKTKKNSNQPKVSTPTCN